MKQAEKKEAIEKIALTRWRALLDKVFSLQALVSLEDSVNTWLPPQSVEQQVAVGHFHSAPSSEQLKELIVTAEPLAKMKSKFESSCSSMECSHPAVQLMLGGNQFSAWVTCRSCHSRWKAPFHMLQKKSKGAKAKSAATPAVEAKTSTEEMMTTARKEAQRAVEQEFKAEVAKVLREEREKTKHVEAEAQRRSVRSQEEMRELRSELKDASKMATLNNIMMSQWATMHMGKKYEEHAGYYDGEMFVQAEQILSMREEMEAMSQLQKMQEEYAASQGWMMAESAQASTARRPVRKPSKSPVRSVPRSS